MGGAVHVVLGGGRAAKRRGTKFLHVLTLGQRLPPLRYEYRLLMGKRPPRLGLGQAALDRANHALDAKRTAALAQLDDALGDYHSALAELKEEHEHEYAALSAEQKQLLEHWLQPEAVSAPDITESDRGEKATLLRVYFG